MKRFINTPYVAICDKVHERPCCDIPPDVCSLPNDDIRVEIFYGYSGGDIHGNLDQTGKLAWGCTVVLVKSVFRPNMDSVSVAVTQCGYFGCLLAE